MKKTYTAPEIEKLEFAETAESIVTSKGEIIIEDDNSAGNGDVGRGRGRGGGCDGVPYHRNARTFSSGRNSGC